MPISKHHTTQCNKSDRVESAIYSCYNSAKVFQSSLDEFMKMKKERIHEHPDMKGLTSYHKGYLRGIESCLFHTLQRDWVEWFLYYTNKNGKVVHVRKWGQLPKYIQNSGNFNANHFWKQKDSIVFKPFGNSPSKGSWSK